jgi:hypothetical protein
VYFLSADSIPMLKIGKTTAMESRFAAIQACSPATLTLTGVIRGADFVEKWFHRACGQDRAHGEWFRLTPRTLDIVELALAHGMEAAKDLCPSSFQMDYFATRSKSVDLDLEDDGDAIGDNCRCDRCVAFAARDGEAV